MKRLSNVAAAGLLVLAFLAIFAFTQIRSGTAICQFAHLVSPPDDLYRPIVLERDLLRGTLGRFEYSFVPNYCDVYEIGLLSNLAPLPSSFDPGVKMSARIRSERGDLLAEIDSGSPTQVSLAASGEGAGRIVYGSFGVPARVKKVIVELEVSNATVLIEDEVPFLDFYVGVSVFP